MIQPSKHRSSRWLRPPPTWWRNQWQGLCTSSSVHSWDRWDQWNWFPTFWMALEVWWELVASDYKMMGLQCASIGHIFRWNPSRLGWCTAISIRRTGFSLSWWLLQNGILKVLSVVPSQPVSIMSLWDNVWANYPVPSRKYPANQGEGDYLRLKHHFLLPWHSGRKSSFCEISNDILELGWLASKNMEDSYFFRKFIRKWWYNVWDCFRASLTRHEVSIRFGLCGLTTTS